MHKTVTTWGTIGLLCLGLGACDTVSGVFERGDTGESARETSGKRVSKQGVGGLRPREAVRNRPQYESSKSSEATAEADPQDTTSDVAEQTVALAPVRPSNSPAGLTIASTQENLQAVISRASISQRQFSQVQNRHLKNIAQYEIAKNALVGQLDAGAVAGDPVLMGQWNTTQSALNQVTSDLNGLNAAASSLRSEDKNLAALKEQLPLDSTIASEDAQQLGILRGNIDETEQSVQNMLSRIRPLVEEKERFISKAQTDLRQLESKVRGN